MIRPKTSYPLLFFTAKVLLGIKIYLCTDLNPPATVYLGAGKNECYQQMVVLTVSASVAWCGVVWCGHCHWSQTLSLPRPDNTRPRGYIYLQNIVLTTLERFN